MYNDEHFEYERIQNRTLRIEKLKLISNINTDDIPDLYIIKKYIFVLVLKMYLKY